MGLQLFPAKETCLVEGALTGCVGILFWSRSCLTFSSMCFLSLSLSSFSTPCQKWKNNFTPQGETVIKLILHRSDRSCALVLSERNFKNACRVHLSMSHHRRRGFVGQGKPELLSSMLRQHEKSQEWRTCFLGMCSPWTCNLAHFLLPVQNECLADWAHCLYLSAGSFATSYLWRVIHQKSQTEGLRYAIPTKPMMNEFF